MLPNCSFVYMYSSRTVGVSCVHRRLGDTVSICIIQLCAGLKMSSIIMQRCAQPKAAMLDLLVLELSLGLPSILWYRWALGSLLFTGLSITDNNTLILKLTKQIAALQTYVGQHLLPFSCCREIATDRHTHIEQLPYASGALPTKA